MLFRVNSVKDVNHGAGEGKEIESHLYETADGKLKRFFDEKDIQKFFADWEKLYIHEEVMGRYGTKKYCGEVLLRLINNFATIYLTDTKFKIF